MPEFPNFYILYGPNTNGGEIISALQRQAEFAVRSIKRLRRPNVAAVEARPWFYRRYNQWIQSAIAKTVWVQANNYYKSPSGRVVTQWPYGAVIYTLVTKLLRRPSERVFRASPSPVTGRQRQGGPANARVRVRIDDT
ncbi:hypothetical protein [Mycobacterium sp.]|uniref:hypothetical protein n=1 Tax=Mycobacterium sp. TaxID=1785 RepID=UPI003F9CA9C7